MLSFFDEAELKYKISILLQLESETKARLRPAMMNLGLDLRENPASRQMGLDMAASMKGKSWNEIMEIIISAVEPAINRYKEIVENSPAEYSQLTEYMLSHESSMLEFAKLELAGESEKADELISAQLINKLN
jgi:hypothetical protein